MLLINIWLGGRALITKKENKIKQYEHLEKEF